MKNEKLLCTLNNLSVVLLSSIYTPARLFTLTLRASKIAAPAKLAALRFSKTAPRKTGDHAHKISHYVCVLTHTDVL